MTRRVRWYVVFAAGWLAALNVVLASVDLFTGDTAGAGNYGYRTLTCVAVGVAFYLLAERKELKS